MTEKPWYELHSDDRYIDEVRVETAPRYKTSGLSGDEWRFSYRVSFFRKGVLVSSKGFGRLDAAVAWIPWGLMTVMEDLSSEDRKRVESQTEHLCMNPGCKNLAISTYRLKKDYCVGGGNCGQEKKMYSEHRIRFCRVHLRRGDCGYKDADSNYEVVEGEGPEGSMGVGPYLSESQTVVVNPGSLADLSEAIDKARRDAKR